LVLENALIGEDIMNNILIETQRLFIRELKTTDFESVHCYASDPIIVKYVVWGPNTPEATMDFLQKAEKEQNFPSRLHYNLGIVLKKENILIGGCALYITSSHNREAALGYCLNKNF
jgi:[ribosomal protein S5]-alanine N-acetyltransferase